MPPQSSLCTRRLYNCTRTASAFAQVEPSNPVIAIHMMAPGPPMAIAVATPTILSTPTREDRVKARVWNGDKPPSPDSLSLCRSEEHTSELQSRGHLVCRLLLEKKKSTDMR